MEKLLYHGSKIQDLQELIPFEKFHKGSFVYAISSKEAALLFSANYHILKVMIYAEVLEGAN